MDSSVVFMQWIICRVSEFEKSRINMCVSHEILNWNTIDVLGDGIRYVVHWFRLVKHVYITPFYGFVPTLCHRCSRWIEENLDACVPCITSTRECDACIFICAIHSSPTKETIVMMRPRTTIILRFSTDICCVVLHHRGQISI